MFLAYEFHVGRYFHFLEELACKQLIAVKD